MYAKPVGANQASLDYSWGVGGRTQLVDAHWESVQLARDSLDRVYTAGTSTSGTSVKRYSSAGVLDLTFGSQGIASTAFCGGGVQARGVAVQSDGKVVAAGRVPVDVTQSKYGIFRLTSAGLPDSTFGDGGCVTATFGSFDYVRSVAIQADQKIIVTGGLSVPMGSTDSGVLRYTPNGQPDGTFGETGLVRAGMQLAYEVLVQPDQKIVVVGKRFGGGFALARFDSAGALDPSFGLGGRVETNFGDESDFAYNAALQPGGEIVAMGRSGFSDAVRLARYTSSGMLDAGFGNGGSVLADVVVSAGSDVHGGVASQADGAIIVAGGVPISPSDSSQQIGVQRFISSGVRDSTFGPNGLVATSTTNGTAGESATDVLIQPDGKILVGGGGVVSRLGYTRAHIPADFDGNRRSDIAVFRPSSGQWLVWGGVAKYFGLQGDIPVPCDFDGNGTTDIAVFRPDVGGWYVEGWPTTFFGLSGDIPVPADYNGDGACDIAVYRPVVGGWYIQGREPVFFGLSGDVPVPGDYDYDGTADITVYRPSVGGWYREGRTTRFFGLPGDIPVPADYDGNGTIDISVFRPPSGGWYREGVPTAYNGLSGDVPVPGDYDGSGTADVGVYRKSSGQWLVPLPQGQGETAYWGLATDIPLPLPAATRLTVVP